VKNFLPAFCVWGLFALTGCAPDAPDERAHHPLPEGAEITDHPPGQTGGSFVYTLPMEPRTFNALIAEDAYAAQIIALMLPGLTTLDPFTQKPKGELAHSWEISEDRKSYTVRLREGLKWSDGAPFTADDVVFTFDTIFAKDIPNRYRQQYTIGGQPLRYEKIDAHTLRFSTAKPYAPFLNDLGFISILPKHKLERFVKDGTFKSRWSNQTAMDTPQEIVALGAFRIHSYRPGERIVLEPNPHYWKADKNGQRLPYIDRLIIKFIPDANTGTLLFATGQVDAAVVSPSDVAWVRKSAETYDFTIHNRGADTGIFFIYFNLKSGHDAHGDPYGDPVKKKWFSNLHFRRALMHAIDRPGLIQAVMFGQGGELDSIISPANGKWHNPHTKKYKYDPARAKEELNMAGFSRDKDGQLTDGEGNAVQFELLVADGSERSAKIATTFLDNMAAIGITVRLAYLDFGTLISRTSDTFSFDAAMLGLTGGGDPSGGKAVYRSDGRLHFWNPSQPKPETDWEKQIDALFDASESEFDEAKRVALIYEMQDVISEQVPLLFMVTPNSFMGLQNRWQGVRPPPIGSLLWNLESLWEKRAQP